MPKAARREAPLYLAVALGSMVGAVLRVLVSAAGLAAFGPGFPWGTLAANVTGSLAIGFYAALTGPDGRLMVAPRRRHFVMTGICGGYTTFSAFSLETLQLIQAGRPGTAVAQVILSVVAWLAAAWLGHALATRMSRAPRSRRS